MENNITFPTKIKPMVNAKVASIIAKWKIEATPLSNKQRAITLHNMLAEEFGEMPESVFVPNMEQYIKNHDFGLVQFNQGLVDKFKKSKFYQRITIKANLKCFGARVKSHGLRGVKQWYANKSEYDFLVSQIPYLLGVFLRHENVVYVNSKTHINADKKFAVVGNTKIEWMISNSTMNTIRISFDTKSYNSCDQQAVNNLRRWFYDFINESCPHVKIWTFQDDLYMKLAEPVVVAKSEEDRPKLEINSCIEKIKTELDANTKQIKDNTDQNIQLTARNVSLRTNLDVLEKANKLLNSGEL